MSNATLVQKLLIAVGAIVCLGGIVCVALGFGGFAGDEPGSAGADDSMMLFAAGGFAMVIGFGIVAFTRSAILSQNGGHTRITIEHGRPPVPSGGRFCSSCGRPVATTARFCESCGHAVG